MAATAFPLYALPIAGVQFQQSALQLMALRLRMSDGLEGKNYDPSGVTASG